MEEGERRPLLSQDTVGQEPPPSVGRLPTWSPRGAHMGAWGCSCSPSGAMHQALTARIACTKYLTVLSSAPSSLLGLLALVAAPWGLAVKGSLGGGGGALLPLDALLGLALGGLAVGAVSLAGCLGALCESTCLLRCSSGGVLTFLGLEALGGALLVVLWGQLQDGLQHTLHVAITRYQDDPDLRFLLDQVQMGLQCCGAASYWDWLLNPNFNCSTPGAQACSLPTSCCIDPWEDGAPENDQCGFGALGLGMVAAQGVLHLEGCGPLLRRWLHGIVSPGGACGILLMVVQAAELLVAAQLLRALAARKGAAEGPGAGRGLGVSTGAPAQARPAANLADSADFPSSPGSWEEGPGAGMPSGPQASPPLPGKGSE